MFDNAINVAIAASRDAYERMAFREALKAAAYDLGNARDVYRWGRVCAHVCVVAWVRGPRQGR